jgi:hypothetical protein
MKKPKAKPKLRISVWNVERIEDGHEGGMRINLFVNGQEVDVELDVDQCNTISDILADPYPPDDPDPSHDDNEPDDGVTEKPEVRRPLLTLVKDTPA